VWDYVKIPASGCIKPNNISDTAKTIMEQVRKCLHNVMIFWHICSRLFTSKTNKTHEKMYLSLFSTTSLGNSYVIFKMNAEMQISVNVKHVFSTSWNVSTDFCENPQYQTLHEKLFSVLEVLHTDRQTQQC
jgi:hypothetical protein